MLAAEYSFRLELVELELVASAVAGRLTERLEAGVAVEPAASAA
jgi:hypothetical protein